MEIKVCIRCKQELKVDKFYKNVRAKYGVGSVCKECLKKDRELNRDRIRQKDKLYRTKNKERLVYDIPEKKRCPKCNINLTADKFYKKKRNKSGLGDICKDCTKTYLQANRIRRAEYYRLYRKKNIEQFIESNRRYKINNKEKIREYNKYSTIEDRKSLSNKYIKGLIVGEDKLIKRKDIPPELVELKRIQLKIKRKLREMNK